MVGRIAITDLSPTVSCGHYPARAVVGETLELSATVFREGHDAVACNVVVTAPDGSTGPFLRMAPGAPGTDRWSTSVRLEAEGLWSYVVEGWDDPLATWWHDAPLKIDAGVDVELMLEEGARLYERAAKALPKGVGKERKAVVAGLPALMRDQGRDAGERLAAAIDRDVVALLAQHPLRNLVTATEPREIWVDRQRALYGAWYEFFPRSEGAAPDASGVMRSGTFRTAMERLPAVADMGFDVVYLPPIHPIGKVNRKGPNTPEFPGGKPHDIGEHDPGSPWAIGSDEGGHDAVHPDLGTLEDFDAFVARTNELGMEVALDLALQAAPDHPWAKEHPEWFTTRADGSIAYAENPPKKYQDIYPINFDNDPDGIYAEVLRVVRHWTSHGVRIFRVDNPHTKPFAFWEWLIGDIKASDPDVIFLSEAFTRPKVMYRLAKLGFSQSYTYFTWRNERAELAAYLEEITRPPVSDFFRPNLFTNTPDILHAYLQEGGRPAFAVRAVLAATLSASYGIYGPPFELVQGVPREAGSEEYLDSEKYQQRHWDLDDPDSLAPLIKRLNAIRAEHPALQSNERLWFLPAGDGSVIAYTKHTADRDDVVLTVVNLDPARPRHARVPLPLAEYGLDPAAWATHDLLANHLEDRTGETLELPLDPAADGAAVFELRRRGSGGAAA